MALSTVLTRNDLQNVLAHINLGDDAHKEITQAEFDALSQEDKDDGTIYFITDGISKNIFLDDNTPVGAIMPYGGNSDPAYWLICDGRAVSRTDYAELFAVIGTIYGTGDGSTTFNIPDLRGRVAVGHNTTYGLGASGGEATHTLVQNEIPNYRIGYMQVPVPGMHAQWTNGGVLAATPSSALGWTGKSNYLDNTGISKAANTSNNAYGWELKTNGGGATHNNMQPYLVTNYIIKVASSAQKEQSNIDLFYPIGSCYETTDSEFDPSIRWGGIWERTNGSMVDYYYTSNVNEIMTVNSSVEIIGAIIRREGKVCQLFVDWSNKNTIAVSGDGNITNVTLGTLSQQFKPRITTAGTSYGDNGGPAFYYMGGDGTIQLGGVGGVARTLSTGLRWQLSATYLVDNSTSSLYYWHRIG